MPTGRMWLAPFAEAIAERASLVGANALRDEDPEPAEVAGDGLALDGETVR